MRKILKDKISYLFIIMSISGIIRNTELIWDNTNQRLFRKLINSNKDFKEVKLKPYKKNKNRDYFIYRVEIDGKTFKLHRVIYKLYNPDWDIYDTSTDNIIDHRNNNPLDNNIDNLKIADAFMNSQNNSHNHWYYCKYNDAIRTSVNINGKQKGKSFSVKKYGWYPAIDLALEWYEENSSHYYKG